jgi:phospholipid transport system substrate-binding protein
LKWPAVQHSGAYPAIISGVAATSIADEREVSRIALVRTLHCGRRFLIAAIAPLFIGAAPPVRIGDAEAAIEPIRQLVDGLLQVMKAGTATPFSIRFGTLAPIIDRTFDLAAIMRDSVGPSWVRLTPNQQSILIQAYRPYSVATYVHSFDKFDGQRFVISPGTRAVGNEQVVLTRILLKAGNGHELDYVMREGGSGWRAVDVLAEGSISWVAVQRSDFRRLLAGGGVLALVDSLRSKTLDLSDGSS